MSIYYSGSDGVTTVTYVHPTHTGYTNSWSKCRVEIFDICECTSFPDSDILGGGIGKAGVRRDPVPPGNVSQNNFS